MIAKAENRPATGISAGGTRATRSELLLLAAITVAAALLRLSDLGRQALWFDEAWTLDIARAPLGDLIGLVSDWESTPPLFYLLAASSVRALGAGEVAVRLPAAIAGVATVLAVWAAARELAGRRAAAVAAALTACSPFMWWYSQEARAYSLAAALMALALWLMARFLRTRESGDLIGWAIASALAISSQYPAGIVVAVSAGLLVVTVPSERRRIIFACLLPGLTGLALVPIVLAQSSDDRAGWIPRFPLRGRAEQLVSQFWLGNPVFSSGASLTAAAVAGLAVLAALVLLARRARGSLGAAVVLPGSVVLGSLLVFTVLAVAGRDMLLARNLIVLWPAFAVTVASCIAAIGKRFALVFTGIACTAMVALIGAVHLDPDLQRNDFRKAASLLGPVPRGGRFVVLQAYPHSRPLTVYAEGLVPPGHLAFRTREIDLVSMELPPPRWCWWGGVCTDGIRRGYSSRPLGDASLLGLTRVDERTLGRFTVTTYRSGRPFTLRATTVSAALPRRLRGAVLWQAPPVSG